MGKHSQLAEEAGQLKYSMILPWKHTYFIRLRRKKLFFYLMIAKVNISSFFIMFIHDFLKHVQAYDQFFLRLIFPHKIDRCAYFNDNERVELSSFF